MTTNGRIPQATSAPIAMSRITKIADVIGTVTTTGIVIMTGTAIVIMTGTATAAATVMDTAMVMDKAAPTIAIWPSRRATRMARRTARTTSRAGTASVRRTWITTRTPTAASATIWATWIRTSWRTVKDILQATKTAGTPIRDDKKSA